MLTLSEIRPYFSDDLQRFPRFMLREYLQYKILEIIYESSNATGLCFLGGTCLRIVHGNRRFSEDLDFDNIALSENTFEEVAEEIEQGLQREGYDVEMRLVMKGAWHCHVKFPGLLYQEGLSGYEEEKILIQLDTEPQQFEYEPEQFLLNRFEVFTTIWTTPLPLLMAQKLYAVLNRDRKKGRDFYDLVFLMGREIRPDYTYLDTKVNISDPNTLKNALLDRCKQMDMQDMAEDVEPFLFDSSDVKKVVRFPEVIKQYEF